MEGFLWIRLLFYQSSETIDDSICCLRQWLSSRLGDCSVKGLLLRHDQLRSAIEHIGHKKRNIQILKHKVWEYLHGERHTCAQRMTNVAKEVNFFKISLSRWCIRGLALSADRELLSEHGSCLAPNYSQGEPQVPDVPRRVRSFGFGVASSRVGSRPGQDGAS